MSISKLSLDALPESDVELTDRDRLALAFGILREQGWYAPIEWSHSLCCANHGWQRVADHYGMTSDQWMETDYDDEPLSIWWNAQADALAFLGSIDNAVMSREMEERVDAIYEASGHDDEFMEQWLLDHSEELDADEMIERTTKLVNLIDTLSLCWSGGMARLGEAIDVMRSVGLIVTEPLNPNQRLVIHPTRTPMIVKRREVDGRVAVWFDTEERVDTQMPHAVLTPGDVENLLAMLRSATADWPQT